MPWGGDSSRIVQFSRVITPVEEIQTWNATSYGFSFVISYQSRSGPVKVGPKKKVGKKAKKSAKKSPKKAPKKAKAKKKKAKKTKR